MGAIGDLVVNCSQVTNEKPVGFIESIKFK